MMDPLGFALENFDAIGRLADSRKRPELIDASGQLADGTPVDGPARCARRSSSTPNSSSAR